MPRQRSIDSILKEWKYEPGEVRARLVRGGDGREVLQMRIDMGLLQLETTNRPDGARPGGAETYFDMLMAEKVHAGEGFVLSEEQCSEADREFVQYYQRRICWLSLGDYRRAILDADHSLAFMDFVAEHSPNDEWTLSHEQYRPFILFHRTQAAALAELEERHADKAVEEISRGLERIRQFYVGHDAAEQFDEDELVERLSQMRQSLREHYNVGRTLAEQLAEAVANEQYERAAQLRDEMERRDKRF